MFKFETVNAAQLEVGNYIKPLYGGLTGIYRIVAIHDRGAGVRKLELAETNFSDPINDWQADVQIYGPRNGVERVLPGLLVEREDHGPFAGYIGP